MSEAQPAARETAAPVDEAAEAAANSTRREQEAEMLLSVSRKMAKISKCLRDKEEVHPAQINVVMMENKNIWQFFHDEMLNPASQLPIGIRNNITSLGAFVFKRTAEILEDSSPDKIDGLIRINKIIATGLLPKTEVPVTK